MEVVYKYDKTQRFFEQEGSDDIVTDTEVQSSESNYIAHE